MLFRFGLPFFLAMLFALDALAQPEAPIYKGVRISLFDFSIKKQKTESVSLQLSVANTGRLPVSFGKKNERPPEFLVIELDTVNLPVLLHGRESLLTEAIRREKIALAPGQMLRNLSLDIQLKAPQTAQAPPTSGGAEARTCADLVFDTVFITRYTDNSMSLQFVIRNTGNATAYLLGTTDGTQDNLAVNAYFVTGTKLTRGAILADGIFIQKSRETLDGLLLPGQMLEGEIELSLSNRTRFAPNLVFELNPFQTVEECDRTNNTKAVVVEF